MDKNDIELLIDGTNFAQAFFAKIATRVKELGGSKMHLQKIFNDEELCARIAADLMHNDCLTAHVCYEKVIGRDLKDNPFTWIGQEMLDSTIPKVCGQKDGKRVFKIFTYDTRSINKVTAKMARDGMRPALFQEALAFIRAYPMMDKDLVVHIGKSSWTMRGWSLFPKPHNPDRESIRILGVQDLWTRGAIRYAYVVPSDGMFGRIYHQGEEFEEQSDWADGYYETSSVRKGAEWSAPRIASFKYVHPAKDLGNASEVLECMRDRGLQPATFEELIGFARYHPKEQLKFPIVALGSEKTLNGVCCVPCLTYSSGKKRLLRVYNKDDRELLTNPNVRYLAVPTKGR